MNQPLEAIPNDATPQDATPKPRVPEDAPERPTPNDAIRRGRAALSGPREWSPEDGALAPAKMTAFSRFAGRKINLRGRSEMTFASNADSAASPKIRIRARLQPCRKAA